MKPSKQEPEKLTGISKLSFELAWLQHDLHYWENCTSGFCPVAANTMRQGVFVLRQKILNYPSHQREANS